MAKAGRKVDFSSDQRLLRKIEFFSTKPMDNHREIVEGCLCSALVARGASRLSLITGDRQISGRQR